MNSVNPTYPAMHIPAADGFAYARQRVVGAVREIVGERLYIPLEYRDGVWEVSSKKASPTSAGIHTYGATDGLYSSNGAYVAGAVRKAQFIDLYL